MSTATIDAPALLPVPDATCADVRAIMDGAAKRSACKTACKKDLSGTFKLTGGSIRAGFVRVAYVKPGFSRPAHHVIASRDRDGYHVTCDCLGALAPSGCKHRNRIAALIPHWPSDDSELLPLTPGDGDGTDGVCGRDGCAGAMHRATWFTTGPGFHSYRCCQTCGRKERAR